MLTMQLDLLRQLFKRAFTNKFPAKHAPKSVNALLKDVKSGKAKLNPAVPTPEGFRGKIAYDRKKCIGCQMCVRVCPANALVFDPKERKITYHPFRCTFCGECVNICPVKCLTFTDEFLLADYRKD